MTYKMHEEISLDFTGPERTPLGFAIHHWDDPALNPQFWPIVKLLQNRSAARSASVNFVAEAGLVACLVSSNVVAWAQGDGASGWGNLNLVSIECNPRCSAEDRETVAELMADQHILMGVPLEAYPHKRFTATACPGRWEQWIPWLLDRARQIVAEKQGQAAPAPAPAPSPAAPAVQGNPSGLSWIVDPGDTLSRIAAYYGIDVADLAVHNGITDPNRISVGQKLSIPSPLYWYVEPGDTLGEIAAYYSIDLGVLAERNGITDPNRISVGQRLHVA